jgi:hypothetical protein
VYMNYVDSYQHATIALKESRKIRDEKGEVIGEISAESVDDVILAFNEEVSELIWVTVWYH